MSAPSATVTARGTVRPVAIVTSVARSSDAPSSGAPSSGAPSSGALPHTRLRITRRGRAVLTALVAAPVVAAALIFAVNGGGAMADSATASQAVAFDHVTVHAGQSLWELAESVAPSADPRDVIAEIMTLNQLESASVMPGQLLAIPAAYSR